MPGTPAAAERGSRVRPCPSAASAVEAPRSVPSERRDGRAPAAVHGAQLGERQAAAQAQPGAADERVGGGRRHADGHVRIAEPPGYPFFLASPFQPELAGDGSHPHPVIRAPARAAVTHAAARARATAHP
ncbi:hypothetical protein AB0K80_22975 [Streptomyces sp. NPDC052682]|uniref:hypothetical protein n=1 Tax=Streptomyces sp. NPDC052682 TaxID=3154954 RepID=UPI0034184348